MNTKFRKGSGYLLLLLSSTAFGLDPQTVGLNNSKLFGCFSMDPTTGDPRPNAKDATCKVVSNVPGDKESVLTIDTTVNTGTFTSPKERPTRVEVRVTKDKGKPVKFEHKITDPATGRSDTTRFDIGAKGEIKSGQTSQNDVMYGWMDKDRCKALKGLVDAIGTQPIIQCMNIAQQAVEPINKIAEELGKSKMRLGTSLPSIDTPSMLQWKAIDTQKMGDVFAVLTTCAGAFALDKAMNEPPPGAKGQSSQGLSSPSAGTAAPQTKSAPARQ